MTVQIAIPHLLQELSKQNMYIFLGSLKKINRQRHQLRDEAQCNHT